MHILHRHPWNLTPTEAVALQRTLAEDIDLHPVLDLSQTRFIAGVDVSSGRDTPLLTAGIIVWDRQTGEVTERRFVQHPSVFPYIPGLLSFREIPVLIEAIALVGSRLDAMLVDGHGIAHPRRLGIAAHLGLLVECPTVGIAKSRLVGTFDEPSPKPGSVSLIMHHGEHIGYALRTKARSNPLLISPGNHLTMESALALVQACLCGYKLPEPTRLVHNFVNAVRRGKIDEAGEREDGQEKIGL